MITMKHLNKTMILMLGILLPAITHASQPFAEQGNNVNLLDAPKNTHAYVWEEETSAYTPVAPKVTIIDYDEYVVFEGIIEGAAADHGTVTLYTVDEEGVRHKIANPESFAREDETYTVTIVAVANYENGEVMESEPVEISIERIAYIDYTYPNGKPAEFNLDGIYYYRQGDNVTVTYGSRYNSFNHYSGDITIPETIVYGGKSYSVTAIGASAFRDCSELTYVNLPNSVTSIGHHAFYNCSGLTNIIIPNSVTSISEGTFKNCIGLTNMSIPNSVTSIEKEAFSGCIGLTNFTIPNSVTSIGGGAFMGCTGFTDFTIPNSVTSIGTGLFAFCTGLNTINVEQGNPIYDSRDNCNAVINTSDNELIAACKNTVIPNTVTSIKGEELCFEQSPDGWGWSYNHDGCGAFTGFNMDSLIIPISITNIGHGAFSGSNIKKLYYNASGNGAYIDDSPNGWPGNCCIPLAGCQADNFIIGNNVRSIEDYDVSGAYFKAIIAHNSIFSLDFSDCDSITTIYLIGEGEWNGQLILPERIYDYENDCYIYKTIANLYIDAGLTSVKGLNVRPSNVYCYATVPPQCYEYTFIDYSGTLHVPAASIASYFTAPHWCNFANIVGDIEGQNSITLNEDSIQIKVGKTFNLSATIDPTSTDNDLFTIWKSSDATIATVDFGQVTGVAEGECDIIVSCLGKQAICHVSVESPISLSLDKTEVTIEKNDSTTLSATILPESESGLPITWTSSNTKVAVVDNGLVTAVDEGECDITATCLGVKAVCHVIVTKPVITIMLDQQEAMVLPNHIITLTPSASTSLPELAVTSSDPTVAAVRLMSGKVQVVGVKEGTSTITVGSADGTAVPATCLVTVYTESGDANCDGFVNISDVTAIINFILNDDPLDIKLDNADYNGDGEANISDVIDLINMILNTN